MRGRAIGCGAQSSVTVSPALVQLQMHSRVLGMQGGQVPWKHEILSGPAA